MPITAKLSRQFYERLGDEVTNELVAWLNAVDESYRQEFRELFGAHFGQVRAEMAQLRTELRADMAQLRTELRADMARFEAEVRVRSAVVDERFASMESRFGARIASTEKRLIRWMFGFWIGSFLALTTVLIALQRVG